MARPTRKHSVLRLFDSPPAAQFRAAIAGTVGGDFYVTATERVGDVRVLRVDAPNERGLLTRALPLQQWAELVAHGWDAHLGASQSGDRSVLDLPAKRRYARRDELFAQVARARDECRQSIFGLKVTGRRGRRCHRAA